MLSDRRVLPLSRMSDPSDARGLAAYQQFWTAAAEYLRWAGHEAMQQVQVARQRLQNPFRPSLPEDVQLEGFTPLHSSGQSMLSPHQVSHAAEGMPGSIPRLNCHSATQVR